MRYTRWILLAVCAAVLLVMLKDLGSAMWTQKKLGEASFASIQWAKSYTFDADKMAAAAQAATDLAGVTVSTWHPCGCPAAAAGVSQFGCNTMCTGGKLSRPYFVVTTSICYRPAVFWPGLSYCSGNDSQCAAAGCTPRQIVLSSQSVALQ